MKLGRRLCWSSASVVVGLLTAPVLAQAVNDASERRSDELQDALLSVTVNGVSGEEPVAALKGAGDTFYVESDVVKSWRLKLGSIPALTRNGVGFYRLNDIAGLTLKFDDASQTLTITTPSQSLKTTRIAYSDVELTDEVTDGKGAFVNYDSSAQLADGATSINGAFEAGVFSKLGVGLSGFLSQWTDEGLALTRLSTTWMIDDPVNMRSLRFGDSVSGGGVGGTPLHFGGIQVARNFAVQPGFVTIPLPTVRGSAALPSVVDIYVNDTLSDRRDVPPGPFEITHVPIVSGNGDVQLVVRDLLGRQTVYTHSYYSAPQLLRKGLHHYSYEAGFLRRSYGRESNDYGAAMLSGTHRFGLTDSLTAEVHGEATRDVQAAGLGASAVLTGIGQFQGALAGSRSERGNGALASLSFQRRTSKLSVGVSSEFATSNYVSIGGEDGKQGPASTIQVFAGIPMSFGSLGFSYLRRDGRNEPDLEYMSANASARLGRFGTLHLAGRRSFGDQQDVSAELFLAVPMGQRRSASAGASLQNGVLTYRTAQQQNLPVGTGFGYQFSAEKGAVDRLDGRLRYQTDFGTYDAQLTWTDGNSGVRLSAAGGLGLVDGHAFASRQLTQSFATVKVGSYSKVRVYADNHLVGRTNSKGVAVIPRLRPFDRNAVRIELSDLPWDAEVSGEEQTVRPYNRHGVAVEFAAEPARGAILRILLENGTPLPAGASVRLLSGGAKFVTAPGGEVYMTGLGPENSAVATWAKLSCRFQFRFAPNDDAQPHLGDVQCRSPRS